MRRYEQMSWGHRPFIPAETALYGGMHKGFDLHIVRLSVGDKTMELEWLPYDHAQEYRVTVARRGGSVGFANNAPADLPAPQFLSDGQTHCSFDGLINGTDYEVTVYALDKNGRQLARSFNRLFRAGASAGTVINYIHPDDYSFGFSGRSIANPDILQLPSGTLLASHQIVWRQCGQNLTVLFRSDDDGTTWHYISDLCPCCGGKLFWHHNALYMLGLDGKEGSWLIGQSLDCGQTWSRPVKLLSGENLISSGSGLLSTSVVFHAGRIWAAPKRAQADETAVGTVAARISATAPEWVQADATAVGTAVARISATAPEWAQADETNGSTDLLSASADSDLLDPESWTLCEPPEGRQGQDADQTAGTEPGSRSYAVTAAALSGAWNDHTANAMIFAD